MCSASTAAAHLERSFHPFTELPAQQQMALFCLLQTVLFDEELLKALEQVVRQQGWGWGRGLEAGKGVEFGPVPG